MASRCFRVGRAATGLGLFATRPIARDTAVVTYRGRRIPSSEARARERRRGAKYMFEINARWTIDGASRRNLARYINHACVPNVKAVLRKGEIVFVALRRIAPDEEITLDYGEEYVALFFTKTGCRCAACRDAAGVANRSRAPPA